MVVTVPSTTKDGSSTQQIFQDIYKDSLKVGEIKGLKGDIEKLKQEMKTKDEMMAHFQKEKQTLQERVDRMKTRLRGKGLL
jgi:predicted RNase H-like nuclease (RuvC/YqgF family)